MSNQISASTGSRIFFWIVRSCTLYRFPTLLYCVIASLKVKISHVPFWQHPQFNPFIVGKWPRKYILKVDNYENCNFWNKKKSKVLSIWISNRIDLISSKSASPIYFQKYIKSQSLSWWLKDTVMMMSLEWKATTWEKM